ncbi:hypothetical protein V492_00697 [Pseudogymnoascus sp. VKM F-4246]|nr:hypothetical protein V492_00697 [Pseudogymnoascus sp. VKM F-4246]
MGNKISKQRNLDPVECGYLYRKDPISVKLNEYAALYHNYDDFDSEGTVSTAKIKAEHNDYRSHTHLSAIVIPIARVLIIQENHIFLGNPWKKKKYDLYEPGRSYTWTASVSNPNIHPDRLGDLYHGRDGTTEGDIQEFLEAYQSGACTGVVVDLRRGSAPDIWCDYLEYCSWWDIWCDYLEDRSFWKTP